MKNIYAEIQFAVDPLLGYEDRTERIMIPLEQCIEWFYDVIDDDEEIDINEMVHDHIIDFATHYTGETVGEVIEYYMTDYDNIEQMDRDRKLKELLNGR